MVDFAGVSHVALSVTDLEVSERFYTEVLEFTVVLDMGYGRMCMHRATGFTLALLKHPAAREGPFSELATGMDHLGFAASSRAELEDWERRFERYGVTYTPIRDMELGSSLNFRDPDDIALEFDAPNELGLAARRRLAAPDVSSADIAAFVTERLGAGFVPAQHRSP